MNILVPLPDRTETTLEDCAASFGQSQSQIPRTVESGFSSKARLSAHLGNCDPPPHVETDTAHKHAKTSSYRSTGFLLASN